MSGIGYYYAESGDIELILTQGQAHTYPWHMHTRHWTAGLVRHGSVLLATDTDTRQLHAGQHFFIRPYEPHSLNVEPESSLLVLCFNDSGALPLDCAPFLRANEKAWIDKVVTACKKNILSHAIYKNPSAACDSLLTRSIREVTRLMMESPAEVLRMDHMAAYAGYSQWHFLRAFQKCMKMTPHAFQLLCRLRLLRSMLRADTASSDAAVSAGFADQSHMHKVFKRYHGMTPGAFKKASFKLELL
jgi:AraC-like DNA-binding protein